MSKYYVINDKEYSVPQIVDRLGVIRAKIYREKRVYEKLRGLILKAQKSGKVLGKEYYAMIELYDQTFLDEKKVKKYVSSKLLKKLYTTNEDIKRLKIYPRK